MVVDKPAGLPVHATLDNYVDNAKFVLERELGQTLYSTHRLDVPTQGLLILAKNARAQSLINKNFANGKVQKIYRAITQHPVPPGPHVLYLNPEDRVPRAHAFAPLNGWWECRLVVLHSESCADGYLHRIQLLTGKTHQIRAQLSALGAPILGDVPYGGRPTKKYVPERLALECFSLSLPFRSRTLAFSRPSSRSIIPLG